MEITKEEFEMYESIRDSGLTNMFDVNAVISYSNGILNRDKCIEIMRKYSILKNQYGGENDEKEKAN